jgi:two-component system nitrogen regulation response regulator NtrX
MKSRILVIDDEPAIRDTMRMILEYDGHDVLAAARAGRLTLAERESPDSCFSTSRCPASTASSAQPPARHERIAARGHHLGARHGRTALEAGRLGAFRFIEKPLSRTTCSTPCAEAWSSPTLGGESPAQVGAGGAASDVGESAASSRPWTRSARGADQRDP